MSGALRLTCSFAEDEASRLDRWLAEQDTGLTRSAAQKLIEDGAVSVNGKPAAKNYRLKTGDEVVLVIPQAKPLEAVAQNIPLEIVYQDSELLVVNKPKGMVVHPAAGNPDGTLVNALLYHCDGQLSAINGVIRPGIVHRIDKNTSGLLIVAKTDAAHNFLAVQIKAHSFTREYLAIVAGHFTPEAGTIDAPIGRDPQDRKKMCVTARNSRSAVTHYQTLEEYPASGCSLVRFQLETGRTHQIRVHCAYKNHPVLGDDVYSTAKKGLDGQCLHAWKIGFVHPDGRYLEFTSDPPDYFQAFLSKLRKRENSPQSEDYV
ncbi:MAG: RluA family pseudouridine synthase [Oscillospiraceae bacterium]